jgi:hypothetical protein
VTWFVLLLLRFTERVLSVDARLVLRVRGGAMSEMLLDRAGRRRSPATVPGFHAVDRRETKVFAIRQIRPKSKRSSLSCARPATLLMGDGYAD